MSSNDKKAKKSTKMFNIDRYVVYISTDFRKIA